MSTISTTLHFTSTIAMVVSCVLASQETSLSEASAQSRAQSHLATRSEKTSSPLVKYTDDRGRTHYASDLDSVPAQFRGAAETGLNLPEVTYQDHVIEQPLRQTSPYRSPNDQRASSKDAPSNSPSPSSDDGTLEYIKHWLKFTADTFNRMASTLNGK